MSEPYSLLLESIVHSPKLLVCNIEVLEVVFVYFHQITSQK